MVQLATMDKILGIDFGERKVGLAINSGTLASPLAVIRYKNIRTLVDRLKKVVKDYEIERIMVGVSEGKSAEKAREFGKRLAEELCLNVGFIDETLSTQDVQRLAIEAGIKRKRRREMEDAFAASLILQKFLDSG